MCQGMHTMHIALHDGFTGQTVTIVVDGRQVYHRAGVQTDLRISRADSIDIEAQADVTTMEVSAEPGNLRGTAKVDLKATPYVAVDIVKGAIKLTPTGQPFRYM